MITGPVYSMISGYSWVLQVEFSSIFSDILNTLEELFYTYSMYIFIAIGLVVIYLVLTRVIFRGTTYRTSRKGKVCILTMAGKERSLEYMYKFAGMKEIEVRTLEYLRKYKSVSHKKLEEAVGEDVIQKLVREGFVEIE